MTPPPAWRALVLNGGGGDARRRLADGTVISWSDRALGVRVSIDDFGAGHSSMARLKHLSIDAIKIDRAFVWGLGVDARDRAICALGKALNLDVIGEGVETAAQEAVLAELSCDENQGFLFARPMPAEQIPEFVREHALAQLAQAPRATGGKPGEPPCGEAARW